MAQNIDSSVVGPNIRYLREHLYGLRQTETASLCGVSRSTLRRIEDGEQLPTLPFLLAFCRLDSRYLVISEYLSTRDLSVFPLHVLQNAAAYFRTLEESSDEFIAAWYEKSAAELRVIALAESGLHKGDPKP